MHLPMDVELPVSGAGGHLLLQPQKPGAYKPFTPAWWVCCLCVFCGPGAVCQGEMLLVGQHIVPQCGAPARSARAFVRYWFSGMRVRAEPVIVLAEPQ